ncbi:MAG: ABC transporter permease [Streptosporangiaceae bacterium]
MTRTAANAGPAPRGPRAWRGPLRDWPARRPWIWSYLAALITWITIGAIAGKGFTGTLTSSFGLAPFLVLVGIGQMVVITLGNGNIDLSLPNTLTLAAYVSTGVMAGGKGSIALGFLAAIAIGLAVAAINSFVILALRVPPIVATLSVGLIIQSAVLVYSNSMSAVPDPGLVTFTSYRVLGLSMLGLICIAVAVGAGFVLFRTSFGHSLQAIGQKIQAARLTGLRVRTVIVSSYVIAALFAAIAGVLLGAFSSPSLDLGSPYLLNSIAVVVLGGSLIAGGRSNVAGIWGSSLFFLFLLALLEVMGASVAVQDIVQGLLIILVLLLVGNRRDE